MRDAALTEPELVVVGRLPRASNHTLLCRLGGADGPPVVYKPIAGERPLWDFPHGTLARREVAAAELDARLGWGLVPPTVLRDGPAGPGAVQRFVPHDPRQHYFVLVDAAAHREDLVRLATFDLLANNADRKATHVLLAEDGGLRGIDHGLTFHAEPKLRTVVWDLAGAAVPDRLRRDAAEVADELGAGDGLAERLGGLLDAEEIAALAERAAAVAELAALPHPPADRRPYPWPPL